MTFLYASLVLFAHGARGFLPNPRRQPLVSLEAKPQRLNENAEGVLYVNDRCIDCAACSAFAPASFRRADSGTAHIVYRQPGTEEEVEAARAALAACPVAAIRMETLAERRHGAINRAVAEASWSDSDQRLVDRLSRSIRVPFPRRFLDDDTLAVYWLGHHNEASFGATPYLLKAHIDDSEKPVYIMIDTPKYSKSSIRAVENVTGLAGPDYLLLTHVDDTADHGKWAEHYAGSLRRIFHSGDLGRYNWLGDKSLEDVEILLQPPLHVNQDGASLTAYSLDGELLKEDWMSSSEQAVVVLHTPGHSPGSVTLWDRCHNILFTGDSYAWTARDGGRMTGFPRYGRNAAQQIRTLQRLLGLPDWTIVAPGHGLPRDYRGLGVNAKKNEMQVAVQELTKYIR